MDLLVEPKGALGTPYFRFRDAISGKGSSRSALAVSMGALEGSRGALVHKGWSRDALGVPKGALGVL